MTCAWRGATGAAPASGQRPAPCWVLGSTCQPSLESLPSLARDPGLTREAGMKPPRPAHLPAGEEHDAWNRSRHDAPHDAQRLLGHLHVGVGRGWGDGLPPLL